MQINPYLFYNGNCEAAFKFYEKVLGAKVEAMLRNEEAPESMPSPPERLPHLARERSRSLRRGTDSRIAHRSNAGPRSGRPLAMR